MSVHTSFHVIYGIDFEPTKEQKRSFFDHLDKDDLWEKVKDLYVSDMDGNHIYFGHSFFNSGSDHNGFDGDWYQNINIMGPYLQNIEDAYIKRFLDFGRHCSWCNGAELCCRFPDGLGNRIELA